MNINFLKIAIVLCTFLAGLVAVSALQTHTPAVTVDVPSVSSARTELPPKPEVVQTLGPRLLDLRINGIGIGSSSSEVLSSLGKPVRMQNGEFNECIESAQKTIHYNGLEFELHDDGKGRDFAVTGFEVTSPDWIVSGISIGDSAEKAETLFGPFRNYESDTEGSRMFFSTSELSGGVLIVKDGRVIRISVGTTFC